MLSLIGGTRAIARCSRVPRGMGVRWWWNCFWRETTLTSTRRTRMVIRVKNKHEVVVRLLLARDDIQTNSKDSYGDSPLSYAAKNGYEEMVRLLLARDDVEVNSKDSLTAIWSFAAVLCG